MESVLSEVDIGAGFLGAGWGGADVSVAGRPAGEAPGGGEAGGCVDLTGILVRGMLVVDSGFPLPAFIGGAIFGVVCETCKLQRPNVVCFCVCGIWNFFFGGVASFCVVNFLSFFFWRNLAKFRAKAVPF